MANGMMDYVKNGTKYNNRAIIDSPYPFVCVALPGVQIFVGKMRLELTINQNNSIA